MAGSDSRSGVVSLHGLPEKPWTFAEWVGETGGLDPNRERCDNCDAADGPFTAAEGLCLICAARSLGGQEAEAAIVSAVLDALLSEVTRGELEALLAARDE